MPCNSDYLEPTAREYELNRAARLLVFVKTRLGEAVSQELTEAASATYCKADFVPELCERLNSLEASDQKAFEALVFDGRDKDSRDLADWREAHLAADAKRIAKEAEEKREAERRPIADTMVERLMSMSDDDFVKVAESFGMAKKPAKKPI